jgi:hypothetical protein
VATGNGRGTEAEAVREYCADMAFQLAGLARLNGEPFAAFLLSLAYYELKEPSGLKEPDLTSDEMLFVPRGPKRGGRS